MYPDSQVYPVAQDCASPAGQSPSVMQQEVETEGYSDLLARVIVRRVSMPLDTAELGFDLNDARLVYGDDI